VSVWSWAEEWGRGHDLSRRGEDQVQLFVVELLPQVAGSSSRGDLSGG
jgi:hypothetical protein